MRSYKQFCALAKALDVVGDRWTLLMVRELLIRGSCRYTDLRTGLPGIPTNLLVDRLRELEHAALIVREEAPPPIATTLFRLTARGKELEPVLQALGHWGAPLLAKAPGKDTFRTHWLKLPLEHHLCDTMPARPAISIELRTGEEPLTLETVKGKVQARPGAAQNPDAVISGRPQLVLAVLMGKLSLNDAQAAGLRYEGDPAFLQRVRAVSANRSTNRRRQDGQPVQSIP